MRAAVRVRVRVWGWDEPTPPNPLSHSQRRIGADRRSPASRRAGHVLAVCSRALHGLGSGETPLCVSHPAGYYAVITPGRPSRRKKTFFISLIHRKRDSPEKTFFVFFLDCLPILNGGRSFMSGRAFHSQLWVSVSQSTLPCFRQPLVSGLLYRL